MKLQFNSKIIILIFSLIFINKTIGQQNIVKKNTDSTYTFKRKRPTNLEYLRSVGGVQIDKKIDSIIRLSLKQNIVVSQLKDAELDNNGLLMNFLCKDWKLNISYLKKIDSLMPNFYGLIISIQPNIIGCNDTIDVEKVSNKIFKGYYWSFKVLIAVNKKEQNILIVTFNVTTLKRSRIARFFNLTNETKNYCEFIPYLKLKFYFDNFTNIKFYKKNKKWIYFSAIDHSINKKIYIKINRNDFDEVIYLGWKISGKYRDKEKIKIM